MGLTSTKRSAIEIYYIANLESYSSGQVRTTLLRILSLCTMSDSYLSGHGKLAR